MSLLKRCQSGARGNGHPRSGIAWSWGRTTRHAMLLVTHLIGLAACGITDVDRRELVIRPAQPVYEYSDTRSDIRSTMTVVNRLQGPIHVYPECIWDFNSLFKLVDGTWMRVYAAGRMRWPQCSEVVLSPGDSAQLPFVIPLSFPEGWEGIDSDDQYAGTYRAEFCIRTISPCTAATETFELRFVAAAPPGGD